METELWNLTVKGNDLTAYTQRFQELILLCTRMVPDEEDRVERFIGGLRDNIQGNMIAANPAVSANPPFSPSCSSLFSFKGSRVLAASRASISSATRRVTNSSNSSRVMDAPDRVLGIFLQHINITLDEISR
ncbi:reverse transcriptase domain-containing protein [Tanacetum coccineum]